MSPRAYRLGRRQVTADLTRSRILESARDLLNASDPATPFSVESVARQAGVARMTVYHQFGNRPGLLDALFESFAAGGLEANLRAAFERSEPGDALDGLVAAFCDFWASDRRALRRVRALAPLDSEIGQRVQARDERRRDAIRILLRRGTIHAHRPWTPAWDDAVDVVYVLTGFETFDALACDGRSPARTTEVLQALVRSAVASAMH